jgi:tetratricopeptide (TPR) repeat protein
MTSRRPLVLMAVLLVLLFGYFSRPFWERFDSPTAPAAAAAPVAEPLLPGDNSISNLVVTQRESGEWQVSFDYFHRGRAMWIESDVDGLQGHEPMPHAPARLHKLERGAGHATLDLAHPGPMTASRQVVVVMRGTQPEPLASARVDHLIQWPDFYEYQETTEFWKRSPEVNLERAVMLIDSGGADAYAMAKKILERLVQRDPSLEPAYIELARIAMKTNWGPEGLHHAEGLLSSALQIKPDSVNAKILLGYVYTHQNRYRPAEKLFAEAAALDPPNLWLWANWGEALAKQGKFEQAAAKYREAVDRPKSLVTYERARADAYTRLLALLERKKDLDGMEALYKNGVVAFGESSCHSLKYARFLLQRRGNPQGAIDLARKSLDVCCCEENARQILGLAHYVAWSKGEGAARMESLNQARIYLPPGAKAMYLLAASETTAKAAAQLVASGENIDNKDNDRLNALAHAIENDDEATARRLLRMGASPATQVGYGDVPVALMPVMSGNLELVKLMRQFGADYGKLTYQGATAFDFAKQTGDSDLLQALEPAPRTL